MTALMDVINSWELHPNTYVGQMTGRDNIMTLLKDYGMQSAGSLALVRAGSAQLIEVGRHNVVLVSSKDVLAVFDKLPPISLSAPAPEVTSGQLCHVCHSEMTTHRVHEQADIYACPQGHEFFLAEPDGSVTELRRDDTTTRPCISRPTYSQLHEDLMREREKHANCAQDYADTSLLLAMMKQALKDIDLYLSCCWVGHLQTTSYIHPKHGQMTATTVLAEIVRPALDQAEKTRGPTSPRPTYEQLHQDLMREREKHADCAQDYAQLAEAVGGNIGTHAANLQLVARTKFEHETAIAHLANEKLQWESACKANREDFNGVLADLKSKLRDLEEHDAKAKVERQVLAADLEKYKQALTFTREERDQLVRRSLSCAEVTALLSEMSQTATFGDGGRVYHIKADLFNRLCLAATELKASHG